VETPAGAPAAEAAAVAAVAPAAAQESSQAPTEVPPTPVPETPTAAAPLVPEPPAVREGDLVELGGDVIAPEPVFYPKPAYPPLAARQRVGGTVFLSVLVDENGAVRDVSVLRGVQPDLGLAAAAANAVRTWRYRPATKSGVRVKVRITQPIPFRP
jgi:protein TonB